MWLPGIFCLPLFLCLLEHGLTVSFCLFSYKWTFKSRVKFLLNLMSIWETLWASLVAQAVKNSPAMQDTRVRSLGQEDPLDKDMETHPSILAWKRSLVGCSPSYHTESDTIAGRSTTIFLGERMANHSSIRAVRIPWTVWKDITLEDEPNPGQKEISPEYSLERALKLKLRLQSFGHLMQRAGSLEKTLMLGKTEGKRRRGWQGMRWVSTMDSIDMNLSRLWDIVERVSWHTAVHGVTKSWTQLSDLTNSNNSPFSGLPR